MAQKKTAPSFTYVLSLIWVQVGVVNENWSSIGLPGKMKVT